MFLLGATRGTYFCVIVGYKRFANDIKLMIGKEPSRWWLFCWMIAGPIVLIVRILSAFIYQDNKMNNTFNSSPLYLALSMLD